MSVRTTSVALVTALMATAPTIASAGEVVGHYETTETDRGTVYQIHPTDEARSMGSSGSSHDPGPEMAGKGIPATASLADQLVCHIVFAQGKPVWNLESWRPTPSKLGYISSGCNP